MQFHPKKKIFVSVFWHQNSCTVSLEDKAGRFMSLDCSIHWNDLAVLMKSLYPSMPAAEPVDA